MGRVESIVLHHSQEAPGSLFPCTIPAPVDEAGVVYISLFSGLSIYFFSFQAVNT